MKLLLFASITFVLAITNAIDKTPTQQIDYAKMGDSVSVRAQQVLLKNLMTAIQQKGTAHAVAFCNEKAMILNDSLSEKFGVKIQRISAKNRNRANAANKKERMILDEFETNANLDHKVVKSSKGNVFYKPIRIGMPTCLQCHGKPNQDINSETMTVITQKYPSDKAVGYQLGQLRGAWKITFSN